MPLYYFRSNDKILLCDCVNIFDEAKIARWRHHIANNFKRLHCWQAILGQCWRNIVYNIGTILGTILPQCWQCYTTTIVANIADQYWANVGHNIGPILVKYAVQYWPNIGYNIAPILAALYTTTILANIFGQHWVNIGHKYWTNIGRICCTILSQYWVKKIVTILASTHSYDNPPI